MTGRMWYVGVLLAAFSMGGASLGASAQSVAPGYPDTPIRFIVPYPPGGVVDSLARTIGSWLTARWGQQAIIDNRVGGNGLIGMEAAAKAVPDGYSLLFTSDETLVMKPHLYQRLPYDPVKSFEPISQVASVVQALCVHASVPANSIQELIRLAKAKPGELTYASTGIASTTHLNTELLKSVAGIDVVHVPYKGGGPAITDLAGGQISMMIIAVRLAEPHIRSGRARALAVASATRSPLLPNVPTFAEAGIHGYEAQPWFGLLAPAGTPKEMVAKVHAEVVAALASPELEGKFRAQGLDLVGSTPDAFAAFMRTETARWAQIIRQVGVKLE